MALPAPVSEQKAKQEELGVIQLSELAPLASSGSSSLATIADEPWPLDLAAKLLERYRRREAAFPDLDQIAASKTVELHCTPDLGNTHDYAPFAVTQLAVPSSVYSPAKETRMGLLPTLERVWFARGKSLSLWQYGTTARAEDAVIDLEDLPADIVSVDVVPPAYQVFVESVRHILVVTTTESMHLFALSYPESSGPTFKITKNLEVSDTGLAIPAEGLGKVVIRATASGRIFFAAENSGISLWEAWYSNTESWFRAKTGKVCHWGPGLGSGFLSGLFGASGGVGSAASEHVVDMCIDESNGLLYTLTSSSAINVFRIKQDSRGLNGPAWYDRSQSRAARTVHTLEGVIHNVETEVHSIERALHLYHPPNPAKDPDQGKASHDRTYTLENIRSQLSVAVAATAAADPDLAKAVKSLRLVSLSALTDWQSSYVRLVAVAASGHRVYLRTAAQSRTRALQAAYIHRMPTGAPDALTQDAYGRVLLGGTSLVLLQDHKLFLATLDGTRIQHQVDSGLTPSFSELSGWLPGVQGDLKAITQVSQGALVLTDRALYKIRRRPFLERLEQPKPSVQLANTYGYMEICAAALAVATRPASSLSRQQRENAIETYFRFGGLPVFKKDLDVTRLTFLTDKYSNGSNLTAAANQQLSVRLSALFDGLAIYTVRLLADIWDTRILRRLQTEHKGVETTVSNVNVSYLEQVYKTLSGLVEFLDKNRSFSEGISNRHAQHGTPANAQLQLQMQLQLPGVVDVNVLTQAEHRGLHAVGKLVKSAQQGIAFLLLIMTETADTPNGLDTLLRYFAPQNLKTFLDMTYSQFFTQAKHSDVARELVTCLVNFVINRGDSVDSVARVIQDRCDTYCSANDVLVYKALEYLHTAKADGNEDVRIQSLRRSAELLCKAALAIDVKGLRDIVAEYVAFGYSIGAIEVALAVAANTDLANVAVGYLRDGKPAGDPREVVYAAKHRVYGVIFEDVLDKHPELVETNANKSTNKSAYQLMLASPDEVWHFALYDWMLTTGRAERLAQVETPFVQPYLQLGSRSDLRAADLLWKWYQRRGDLLAAADVLLKVARGEQEVPMPRRVEFLSRAMGYCNSSHPPALQQKVVDLTTMVRAYLQIAVVQSDVLGAVEQDDSLEPDVRTAAETRLNSKLLTVSDLFNDYADPLHYYTICLAIYELSDYRDPVEIRRTWQGLLDRTRLEDELAVTQHYAHIGSLVASLGSRYYGHADFVFPLDVLVPMLEQYAFEYCRNDSGGNAPVGWLVDAFANAGVGYAALFEQLARLRRESVYPFSEAGPAKQVNDDLAYLVERWNDEDSDALHSRVDLGSLTKLIGADEVARVLHATA